MTLSAGLASGAMGFAAGAMPVVIGEIIPESHREGTGPRRHDRVLTGFVVMMLLDTAYG